MRSRAKTRAKMADVQQLCSDGFMLATQAVTFDKKGDFKAAIFFYVEAAEALQKALSYDPQLDVGDKASEYVNRANFLRAQDTSTALAPLKTNQQKDVEKAEFLLKQGLFEDEKGRPEEALPLYTDAVTLCLATAKDLPDGNLKTKLHQLARQALERAEAIKKVFTQPKPAQHSGEDTSFVASEFRDLNLSPPPRGAQGASVGSTSANDKKPGLKPAEIEVLKKTSYINGRLFPPWLDIDLKERFAFSDLYNDKEGRLALSPKQKTKFAKWARPSEFCDDPQMIYAVSSFSIKQTIVSDCSFVASLAISADYEKRFRKRLITSIIFPQSRDGKPLINPSGKYMIKLRLNGIARKVIIDDTLPMGRDGELLCSYSTNHNEMWISLVEKAYMKVMGGYDFPGSNSSIDLHALTGWIPERMSIKRDSPDFKESMQFDRLMTGLRNGDCLITVATGHMSEAEAERAGLVPTHAYAVLDIKKVQGHRLFQLKNPWSHLRWKGKFSERDTESWTPELQRALNYDRMSALQYDNGVFWISWEGIMHFYDVIYLNWNPKLFKFRSTLHSTWTAKEGPKKDSYNIGGNPQYKLEVNAGNQPGLVWILLTRHITRKDDFAENKEFITVHVYKTDGARVYYPDDPYLEGTKINSPFYLAKLNTPKGSSKFTLIVSQYEKTNTIHYTLKVFSSSEFRLSPVVDPYEHEKQITEQWTSNSAGGCPNYPTHSKNPTFSLDVRPAAGHSTAELLVKILAPKQYSVGVVLRSVERSQNGRPVYESHSDSYRPGFCVKRLTGVPAGAHHLIASTFLPGQEGPFILTIAANCRFTINKI